MTTTTLPVRWPRRSRRRRAARRRRAGAAGRWSGAATRPCPPVPALTGRSPAGAAGRPPPTADGDGRTGGQRRGAHQAPLAVRAPRRRGDQVRGRFAVADADDLRALEVEAGEAGQRRTAAGAGRARAACARRTGAASRSAAGARRSTASWPSAADPGGVHARRTSAAAISMYGSPQDGRERVAQHPPVARVAQRRRRRRRPACPRSSCALSISRSSICDRQPELRRRSARRSAGPAPAGWPPRA